MPATSKSSQAKRLRSAPGALDHENKKLHEDTMTSLLSNGHSEESAHKVMRQLFGHGYHRIQDTDRHPAPAVKDHSSPLVKAPPSRASSSPLSDASAIQSPSVPAMTAPSAKAPSPDSDSEDEKQPPPTAAQPQFQTFGTNPLTFDDPTIYEIRPVTDDMTDGEKKEIYCVASFPPDDLHDLIAGTPPNKDFSHAVKPQNPVQAHTFAAYLDQYLRPLKEEDIGFLNERVSMLSMS